MEERFDSGVIDIPSGYRDLMDIARASEVVNIELLESAIEKAVLFKTTGINEILDAGLVKEDLFLAHLADHLEMDWLSDELQPVEPEQLKKMLPATVAVSQMVCPIEIDAEKAVLAYYDPLNIDTEQLVNREINVPVQWKMASRRRVREALSQLYGVGAGTFESVLDGRADYAEKADEAMVIDDVSEEESVLKFVNNIIREAIIQQATDIHVEPQNKRLRIRYRVDGHLSDVPIPTHIHKLEASVIARIKIMAHLDVAERRLPQDGRINLSHEGKSIDVRVASIPSIEGETISLRLLNQERFDLSRLELEDNVQKEVEKILSLSNGVILATGPTGSGKSTSLYCFLDKLNTAETRTVTIEDPVENKLPGIVQIAVKPEVGLTFAKGLRSILRADPNIVMVGEIRDTETAEIAIRASLTGHLVLSTLHTNSALGAVSRLVDMGVEPFLVAASVRGLIAQRLVRRLCSHCKVQSQPWSATQLRDLGMNINGSEQEYRFYEPVGCAECRHTGYHGRVALYEICAVSSNMQNAISNGVSEHELKEIAAVEGYEDIKSYGLRKVIKGITSLEEVLSITHTSSD